MARDDDRSGTGSEAHRHLRRGSALLLVNTAGTSILGVAFWVVVARRYAPTVVGASAAVLSIMLLLANISQVNLTSAMVRFLPIAGRHDRALIVRAYVLVASLGVGIGVGSLPLLRHLSGVSDILRLGPGADVWFVAAIATWTVFALQDAVAIALRGAKWVALENSLYGVAKLALVVGLAASIPRFGIFAAWTIPMALTIPFMAVLTFRRLLPAHRRVAVREEVVSVRAMRGFVSFEYLTGATGLATTTAVQLLVLTVLGARQSAFFYVVWVAVTTVDVALLNVGGSFIAEVAREPAAIGAYARSLLPQLYLLFAPVAVVCVVGAPWLLGVLGRPYATHATTLMRLVGVAFLPRVLVVLWMSVNRSQKLVRRVLVLQVALCSTLVGGVAVGLTAGAGLTVVGVVYLACQSVAAAIVAPELVRLMRNGPDVAERDRAPVPAPVLGVATLGDAVREPA